MNSNNSKKAFIIAAIVFLGMFVGNYGQYQLAAAPSMIFEKFALTDMQFSSVMTSPMLPAIFFSIILGVLADKFGIKLTAAVCIVIGTAGFLIRVAASSYSVLFVSMAMTGVMVSVLNCNLSKIVSAIYPIEKLGKVIGILMAGSTAAMAVAYATTSFFPSVTAAFITAAVISVIVCVGWLFLVREKDFHVNEAPGASAQPSVPVSEALGASIKSSNIWIAGLALAALMGGVMVISNFQVLYLTSIKGYSEGLAGTFGTVLMIGSILGSILLPVYVTKFKNPAIILLILELIVAACTVGMVFLPAAGIYVASFLNGFLRSGIIAVMMSYPIMLPEIGPKYAGTAGGFIATLQLLGAVIIPTYIVIPLAGSNMANYFYIAGIFLVISAVLIWMVSRKIKFN